MHIYYQDLFIPNKYSAKYFQIIDSAKSQESVRLSTPSSGAYERHHIIPRSIRPEISNLRQHPNNGVLLTFKEHFLAHWLLTKMCISNQHQRKMLRAMKYMTISNHLNNRIIAGWQYAVARAASIAANTGRDVSTETRKKISESKKGKPLLDYRGEKHHQFGKKHSQESIEKMIKSRTGMKRSEETKKKLSEKKRGDKNPMYGKTLSTDHKERISASNTGRLVSLDTRQKISESLKKSELMKQHSTRLKDRFKGRKVSDDTREKLRQANQGKTISQDTKDKIRQANTGKKRSDETKKKMSLAKKGIIRITNGHDNTTIKPEADIPAGYWRGTTLKRKMAD